MPRRARVVVPHVAHHITQRGNRRQDIFEEDNDFACYCYFVNEYAVKYRVDILAYCLMNNHVHLIVVPESEKGLAQFMQSVNMRYAQYYNFIRKISGHLWQGRFFSCLLDDEHLFYAMRYVEQNPVRAKMTDEPWDYPWSSARYHVGLSNSRYIALKRIDIVDKDHWKEYLNDSSDFIDSEIRRKTQKGLALAGKPFIDYWEFKIDCVLSERKAGRPPTPK